MAFSAYPLIGFQNLVDRQASTLSSSDVEATSAIGNLAKPRLSTVTNFGTGTGKSFKLDAGAASSVSCVYLRFKGTGWSDITTIRVRGSANSDLSSPSYDVTWNEQFPATWPNDVVRRPIFLATFDATSARYWGVTVTRTAGSANLEIARAYIGPVVQLVLSGGPGNGVLQYGSSWHLESATEELLGDDDADARFVRSARRILNMKLTGLSSAQVKDTWWPQLLMACASRDVLFVEDPTATDETRIQCFNALWGRINAEAPLVAASYDFWEQDLTLRERL
jgi:hypothetical protein